MSEPDSEPDKKRPLTARAKHFFGNGNTLKTVLAVVAALVTIGLIPKISDLYTKTEAVQLEERVSATEATTQRMLGKLETIEKILIERLPAPAPEAPGKPKKKGK